MVNFNAYLQSICDTYAQWWKCYTITDVVGKQRDEKGQSLKPFFDFGLMVEKVKQEQEEKTERLTVIEGLRKYAQSHVLLIGRPGSGKSTALLRVLLESAQNHLEINFQANSESRLKTTEFSTNSQFQLTSAMRQGIDSLADSGENEQIPILVELRYYKTSIIELIHDFLKRHQLKLEINEIEELLFAGKFLLLIDGVNELPSEAARQDLQKFRQDYQQTTPMIFSTRDLGIGGDLGIEKKLQMQPLTETQMRDFVCRYLPEQGEEMLKQLSGRLRELGETPLLLMMLCSVFASNQNKVPANLGSVFRRFTEIYDNKFKQYIPVTDESRRWWKRLLQHLAWVMTHGGSKTGELKTEILVAIPIQEARDVLTKFLKEQDYHQPRDAEKWLDDLLKHHLIQLGADNQIQFRHQLLQEYYAAERLLAELPKLSDDEFQWEYLNYLKWTEPVALMMQLLTNKSQAVDLVKLALEIDWQLGARLAGEVKEEWQEETVGLVDGLEIPLLLKIKLLGRTKSEAAINSLTKISEQQDIHTNTCIFVGIIFALMNIGNAAAIQLVNLLKKYHDTCSNPDVTTVGNIGLSTSIDKLYESMQILTAYIHVYVIALARISLITSAAFVIEISEYLEKIILDNHPASILEKFYSNENNSLNDFLEKPDLFYYKNDIDIENILNYANFNKYHKVLLLQHQNLITRFKIAEILAKTSEYKILEHLVQALNSNEFIQANDGDTLTRTIQVLEQTQQNLKYYKPIMSKSTSHNYALLIGVGECEETKLSLPVTVKDIQALKTLLTDSNLCGYIDSNIRLLYNETATKQKILENLNWLKQQAKNDPEATILIYYSGHGCLDNSGDYYLIPHETDRADIPDTALSAETINQALREIPAPRLLVIIDSCHAQGMASSKNAKSPIPKGFTQTALPKTIIDNLKGTGRVVFTSSTGTQLSWIRSDREMSIYTYHLLEALQGAGNQAGDKVVKVSHLMNYLSKTVPTTTQQEYQTEQTPFFDFATEDFPVALLLGGKGLPEAGYESVKAEAEEKIRNISNQVKHGVGIVGDGNIGFNIGTAGNITIGDISSK